MPSPRRMGIKVPGVPGITGKEKTVSRGRAKAGVQGTTPIWGAGGRREIRAEQREDVAERRARKEAPNAAKVQWAKGLEAPGGGWRAGQNQWREVLGRSSARCQPRSNKVMLCLLISAYTVNKCPSCRPFRAMLWAFWCFLLVISLFPVAPPHGAKVVARTVKHRRLWGASRGTRVCARSVVQA